MFEGDINLDTPVDPAAKPPRQEQVKEGENQGVPGDRSGGRLNLNRRLSERQARGFSPQSPGQGRPRQRGWRREQNTILPPGFEEKVLKVARVVKVVKGGRRFSFSAYVAVGNRRGRIGFGHGKANEVQDAVKKATKAALKGSFLVPIVRETVPHEVTHKFLATRLMIKPARVGRGLVAAGTVRSIVELAGFTNITTKVYGSRNVQNVARCLLAALSLLRSAGEVRSLRQEATTRR